MELRCDSRLHGIISGGVLEVVCRSKFCGRRRGVVVVHFFNLKDGTWYTKFYKDPGVHKEDSNALERSTTVRHP